MNLYDSQCAGSVFPLSLGGASRRIQSSDSARLSAENMSLVAVCVTRDHATKVNRNGTTTVTRPPSVLVNVLYDKHKRQLGTPGSDSVATQFLDASKRCLNLSDPSYPDALVRPALPVRGANDSEAPPRASSHSPYLDTVASLVEAFLRIPRVRSDVDIDSSESGEAMSPEDLIDPIHQQGSCVLLADHESCHDLLRALIVEVQKQYNACISGGYSDNVIGRYFQGCGGSEMNTEEALNWIHDRYCIVRLEDLYEFIACTGGQHVTLSTRYSGICASQILDSLDQLGLNTVGLELPVPSPVFHTEWKSKSGNQRYTQLMDNWMKSQDKHRSMFMYRDVFKLRGYNEAPTLKVKEAVSDSSNAYKVSVAIPTASVEARCTSGKNARLLARARATHVVVLACLYALGLGGTGSRVPGLSQVAGFVTSGNTICKDRGLFQTVTLTKHEHKIDEAVLEALGSLSDKTSEWDERIRELIQRTLDMTNGVIPHVSLPTLLKLAVSFCQTVSTRASTDSRQRSPLARNTAGYKALLRLSLEDFMQSTIVSGTVEKFATYRRENQLQSESRGLTQAIRTFFTAFSNQLEWVLTSHRAHFARRSPFRGQEVQGVFHMCDILGEMPADTDALATTLITDVVRCLQTRMSPVLVRHLTEECNTGETIATALGEAAVSGNAHVSDYIKNECHVTKSRHTLSPPGSYTENRAWRDLDSSGQGTVQRPCIPGVIGVDSSLSSGSRLIGCSHYSYLLRFGPSNVISVSMNCIRSDTTVGDATVDDEDRFQPQLDANRNVTNVHHAVVTTHASGLEHYLGQKMTCTDVDNDPHFHHLHWSRGLDLRNEHSLVVNELKWTKVAGITLKDEGSGGNDIRSVFVYANFVLPDALGSEPVAVIVRTIVIHSMEADESNVVRSRVVEELEMTRETDELAVFPCWSRDHMSYSSENWAELTRRHLQRIRCYRQPLQQSPSSRQSRSQLSYRPGYVNADVNSLISRPRSNRDSTSDTHHRLAKEIMNNINDELKFSPLTVRCALDLSNDVRYPDKYRAEGNRVFVGVPRSPASRRVKVKLARRSSAEAAVRQAIQGRIHGLDASTAVRRNVSPMKWLFGIDGAESIHNLTVDDDEVAREEHRLACKTRILDCISANKPSSMQKQQVPALYHPDVGFRLFSLQSFLGLLMLGERGLPRLLSTRVPKANTDNHEIERSVWDGDVAVISLVSDCAKRDSLACEEADYDALLDTCVLLSVLSFATSNDSDSQPLCVYLSSEYLPEDTTVRERVRLRLLSLLLPDVDDDESADTFERTTEFVATVMKSIVFTNLKSNISVSDVDNDTERRVNCVIELGGANSRPSTHQKLKNCQTDRKAPRNALGGYPFVSREARKLEDGAAENAHAMPLTFRTLYVSARGNLTELWDDDGQSKFGRGKTLNLTGTQISFLAFASVFVDNIASHIVLGVDEGVAQAFTREASEPFRCQSGQAYMQKYFLLHSRDDGLFRSAMQASRGNAYFASCAYFV